MIYLAIAFVICMVIFLIRVYYEEKHFTVTNYVLHTNKKVKDTKFVILSDLHNKEFDQNNQSLINQIHQFHPEMILIAGDMITKLEDAYDSIGHKLLLQLAEHYPIYYVKGNHEQKKEEEMLDEDYLRYEASLKEHGVVFLDNIQIDAMEGIKISGLHLPLSYYERMKYKKPSTEELQQLLSCKPTKEYHILLCHMPSFMKQYMTFEPDLVISGHYHGGMIRFPFLGGVITPQFELFPKYNGGKYQLNGTDIIVSRGLGNHKIKMRFLNKPELICVELKGEGLDK